MLVEVAVDIVTATVRLLHDFDSNCTVVVGFLAVLGTVGNAGAWRGGGG